MRTLPVLFAALLALPSCVVSSYDPPGTPPVVALPEETAATAAPETAGPKSIGASHILISYRGAMRASPYVTRTKEEARAEAESLLKDAMRGVSFAELAREHSDDKGSAQTGGELGVFKREQMVPAFSKAAFALQVGQLSNVVESPFGFHVILRTQ